MRLNPNDLRDALREHADDVVPGPLDPFDGLEERVRSVRRRRRLTTALSGLAVLAVVVAAPIVGRTTSPPERSTGPPVSAPAAAPAVPVYWLHDSRLAREFRQLGPVHDPVAAAVDTMLRSAPLDPDYRSGWPRAATATVRRTAGGFAVDVSRAPTGGCQAVQQLVHTVTAAAQLPVPVVVLVAGKPAARQPGLATCAPAAGVERAPAPEALVAVQISSPNDGDQVGRSFLLDGFSRVVEGSLRWQVHDAATGDLVERGTPTGDVTSGRRWSMRIDLPPTAVGRDVVLTVSGTPAPGAAAGTDTKLLHVTG